MIEILAHESNYTKGSNRKIEYIVIHFTANDGDTARNNGIYFQKPDRNASAHYFVDENEIVRSVKDKDIAWHCGAKTYVHEFCRNQNSIGIEMCSRKDANGKYYIKKETMERASKLTLDLMIKYNIPITHVLRHYDVTGKNCPAPLIQEKEWKEFLNMVTDNLTFEEAKKIVKERYKFDDNTMCYLEFYRFAEALIKRLALSE